MAPLIDTHAHLSMLAKRGIDARRRLAELFAPENAFGGIIDIGTEAEDLPERIQLAGDFPQVRYSAGIWPSAEAIDQREAQVRFLEQHIAGAPPGLIAAVGECGIDRHWNRSENGADLAGERELLELQLDLARRLSLPVIIHSRDAPEETAQMMAAYRDIKRIIHCFSYGEAEARTFLGLGCYISFAGNCTFKNARNIREALSLVPLDRLLLETDCPYLAPVPCRGRPAEPGMVEHIYRFAADLKALDPEKLAGAIAENARELFAFYASPETAI
ncbi:TatD family hydrolase [Treponema sp. OttesenSCG-928-L16]|nr:TatD family hydrolase [Treponema sp. OttesenSCG-928-L16]